LCDKHQVLPNQFFGSQKQFFENGIAAFEAAAKRRPRDDGKDRQIAAFQMQTMDAALLDLSQKGDISYDVAMSNAREPEFIKTRTSKPA
ncbi:MAG TPA: hypothetical protein VK137_17905, partial [Planctomycetaceae bacterium]|nr:hypothetical protein [Planctomycetaceae bacterium]